MSNRTDLDKLLKQLTQTLWEMDSDAEGEVALAELADELISEKGHLILEAIKSVLIEQTNALKEN